MRLSSPTAWLAPKHPLTVHRGWLNTSERDELIKLRKENRELRREKDFFKLAAAHFAKEQLPQKGFG